MKKVISNGSNYKNLCSNIARILLALFFIIVGVVKIFPDAQVTNMFLIIGLGSWFMYFVGLWEIIAGVLLFTKGRMHIGAAMTILASIGAFITQVTVLSGEWLHTVVLLAICLYVARPHKNQIISEYKKLTGK